MNSEMREAAGGRGTGEEKWEEEGGAGKEEKAQAPVLTAEEYARLTEQARQAKSYGDELLRLQAEFENARKRMRKEQTEFERRAGERLLLQFVGIADDFERALMAASDKKGVGHVQAGLSAMHRRIEELLKAEGVEAIPAVGAPFDPALHEAVAHVETTEHPEATVVEELRKGYTLHGRLLRPATVKVAASPSAHSLQADIQPIETTEATEQQGGS